MNVGIRPRHGSLTVRRRRDTYFANTADEEQATATARAFLSDNFSWSFDAEFMNGLRELLGLPDTNADDLRWKIERALSIGDLVTIPDRPIKTTTFHHKGERRPRPKSREEMAALPFFRRAVNAAISARSFQRPTLPTLPADDFNAIMAANPGDMLPDGTIATALSNAQAFEYAPASLDGEAFELAARGVRMTGNEPGGFLVNPNGLDVDYFDANGNLCAQFHASHGDPHGHNFFDGRRDNAHLPMSPINCQ